MRYFFFMCSAVVLIPCALMFMLLFFYTLHFTPPLNKYNNNVIDSFDSFAHIFIALKLLEEKFLVETRVKYLSVTQLPYIKPMQYLFLFADFWAREIKQKKHTLAHSRIDDNKRGERRCGKFQHCFDFRVKNDLNAGLRCDLEKWTMEMDSFNRI